MATEGIYWFDSSGNNITLEYSNSVLGSPLTYTFVDEVKGISRSPAASDEIPFTHYESTRKEVRLGLPNDGSWDIVCNFAPKQGSQATIIALAESKDERFWRIVYPKAVTSSTQRAYEFFSARVQTCTISPPGADETNPVNLEFTLLGTGTYQFGPES